MSTNRPETERPWAQIDSHKLFAPPGVRGAVQRHRVLAPILNESSLRVVVLHAPAGHGKSTLLQQAKAGCESQGRITGWLSFDDADNDMRRFTHHLEALLRQVCNTVESGIDGVGAGQPTRRRLAETVIARLLRLNAPVALFLDEFQTLSNPTILGFFSELLDRAPEPITLFLGSRAVPELGLSRMIVRGHARVLHAEQLQFTQEEASQFFASAQDLGIRDEEIEVIHRQTEGWPAALQLYRLSLANPTVRQSLGDLSAYRPRELAEYLADNVLDLQTPRIRSFLLRTSLLTRLSAPLCDAMLGWQDSQSILLFLERTGLFLRSLDSDLRWFRYHTLFSGFLQEQLRQNDPQQLQELHSRAARWNHAHGFHEEAMHHAVEAGEFDFAAAILNLWSSRIVAEGHLWTVERWYDRLPLSAIAPHRTLAIKIAWALSFLRRTRKLKPLLELLDDGTEAQVIRSMVALLVDDITGAFEIGQQIPVREQDPDSFHAFELGAACNVRAYSAMSSGDYDAAHEMLVLARAHNEQGRARFSGGYTQAVTGLNLLMQGELHEAMDRFRSDLAEHSNGDQSVSAAALVCGYLAALYDADDLSAAEALFAQYHDPIREGVLLDFAIVAYRSMARAHDALGHTAQASELLDEAESVAHQAHWPRLIRVVEWERVRRYLMRGEVDRAQLVASRINRKPEFSLPEGYLLFSMDNEDDQIARIRLAIHRSEHDVALRLLGDELTTAQRFGRMRRQIKLLALEAIAYHRRGNSKPAFRALRRALQLAEPRGFIRCFLEEGDALKELLGQLYPSLQDPARNSEPVDAGLHRFAARLLGRAGGLTPELSQPQPVAIDNLTDSERNILSFLARGASNKEMANQLFVSENTVKFHLKNIYSKLDAGSRLQAINTARRMGLV
jgi:LuxR family maltose regulon positive regulatory protein